MLRILSLGLLQSVLLAGVQVFLKFAVARMLPFSWTRQFWSSVFLNWWFAGCGIVFIISTVLWMNILKHYSLSMAYPMISLSYVVGMIAAMVLFGESVSLQRWIGAALIVAGCCFIAR